MGILKRFQRHDPAGIVVLLGEVKAGEDSIQVRLTDERGCAGRGEAVGVTFGGETPRRMIDQIEAVRAAIERQPTRAELLDLLPHGGARMAIDSALWDLEAKQGGPDPFAVAGVSPDPVTWAESKANRVGAPSVLAPPEQFRSRRFVHGQLASGRRWLLSCSIFIPAGSPADEGQQQPEAVERWPRLIGLELRPAAHDAQTRTAASSGNPFCDKGLSRVERPSAIGDPDFHARGAQR